MKVKLYLDIAFLSQYELDIETFEKGKPFTAKMVDDLLNFANEKYRLNLALLASCQKPLKF